MRPRGSPSITKMEEEVAKLLNASNTDRGRLKMLLDEYMASHFNIYSDLVISRNELEISNSIKVISTIELLISAIQLLISSIHLVILQFPDLQISLGPK